MQKILVVDDDKDMCFLLDRFLSKHGFDVIQSFNGKRALESLEENNISLVLTDFRLEDIDGKELLYKIKKTHPNMPLIIMTGYSDVKIAVEVIKNGAFDYVTKPLFPDEILIKIKEALKIEEQSSVFKDETIEAHVVVSKPKEKAYVVTGPYIFGDSSAFKKISNQILLVAPTNYSVIIYGETGTGKEVIANEIHNHSKRKDKPFVAIDCGALSKELAASELFGHEKGSFTGAADARKGYFETVNGGTIFLDEIGEMPLGTQARLLRVLETGEYIRVGSSKVQKTDVRVIAATNKDLLQLVEQGRFREDLYYRLSTVPIRVPALHDRKEDIHLLFRKFAVDFAEKYKAAPVQLDEDAKNMLINYPWPGNVRELKNIAEQISVLSQDKSISAKELSKFLPVVSGNRLPVLAHTNGSASAQEFANEREILYKLFFDMKKDVTELKRMFFDILQNPNLASQNAAFMNELKELKSHEALQNVPMHIGITPPAQAAQPVLVHNDIHEHEEVEESLNIMDKEKELIIKALKKHRGKRKDAALDLGISERTLYRKLKEYDIEE